MDGEASGDGNKRHIHENSAAALWETLPSGWLSYVTVAVNACR